MDDSDAMRIRSERVTLALAMMPEIIHMRQLAETGSESQDQHYFVLPAG
jgi:hypothetical protein